MGKIVTCSNTNLYIFFDNLDKRKIGNVNFHDVKAIQSNNSLTNLQHA